MGLFSFTKKKKEPDYDPLDVKVTELAEGFIFEYDMESWVVKEAYEYDWGNNFFSKEYKVDNGTEQLFLSVEDDDELELILSKKIKLSMIEPDFQEKLEEKNKAPKKITYKGTKYYLDTESEGFFRVLKKDVKREEADWDRLISWDYYDENDEQVLSIEQWGDNEFEASLGKCLKVHQISNILPAE